MGVKAWGSRAQMGTQLYFLLRGHCSQPSEKGPSPGLELQVRELRPEREAARPRSQGWAGKDSGRGAQHPDSKSMLVSP